MSGKRQLAPVGRGRVALFNSVNRKQIAVAVADATEAIAIDPSAAERERINARYRALGGLGEDPIPVTPPQRYQARGRVRLRVR